MPHRPLVTLLVIVLLATAARAAEPGGPAAMWSYGLGSIYTLAHVLVKPPDAGLSETATWDIAMSRVGQLAATATALDVVTHRFPQAFTPRQKAFAEQLHSVAGRLSGFCGLGKPEYGDVAPRDVTAMKQTCRFIITQVQRELAQNP